MSYFTDAVAIEETEVEDRAYLKGKCAKGKGFDELAETYRRDLELIKKQSTPLIS